MRLLRLLVLLLVSVALPVYGLAAVRLARGSHCPPTVAGPAQVGTAVPHTHLQPTAYTARADGSAARVGDCCGDAAAADGTGAAGSCSDGPACHAAHYLAPATLPATVQVVPDPAPVASAKPASTEAMVSGLWRPPRPF